MNRRLAHVLVLALLPIALATAGCGSTGAGGAPPTEPEGDAPAASPEIAPPPFTAAQIRAATEPGRTYVFQIGQGEGVTAIRTLTFTHADDAGVILRAVMTSPDGEAMGPPKDETLTWEQLVAHASWPRTSTTIEDARVEVPAGAFDAKLYTIRETDEAGRESLVRAWFATALPGAPVRFEQSSDGQTQFLMELVEHHPGTAD